MPGPDEQPVTPTPAAPASPASAQTSAPPDQPPPAGAPTPPEPAVAVPPSAAGSEAPLEAKPAEAAAVPATEPTLLEKFDAEKPAAAAAEPKAEEKPADKPVEAKPEEAKPAAEPAAEAPKVEEPAKPEPVDYFADIKLPETIKLDDASKTELAGALDAVRQDPKSGTQALIDLHNKKMTEFAEHMAREQVRVFNETRQGWVHEVLADPVLGGARHQTAMAAVARVRDAWVPEADRAAFTQFLHVTGAGDNPAFLRFMHTASKYVLEPSAPSPEIKPAPNNGKNPGETRRERMYDKTPTSAA